MKHKPLAGVVLDEHPEMSLDELNQACATSVEWIVQLVEEGVLEPSGAEPAQWRFSATSLIKVRTAARLRQDLDINVAGVALALDLMDEIDQLRERLRRFEQ